MVTFLHSTSFLIECFFYCNYSYIFALFIFWKGDFMTEQEKYSLKQLRKLHKLSLFDCMGVCGVSRRHWYNIEQGKAVIYSNELRQLASIAGIEQNMLNITGLKIVPYGD